MKGGKKEILPFRGCVVIPIFVAASFSLRFSDMWFHYVAQPKGCGYPLFFELRHSLLVKGSQRGLAIFFRSIKVSFSFFNTKEFAVQWKSDKIRRVKFGRKKNRETIKSFTFLFPPHFFLALETVSQVRSWFDRSTSSRLTTHWPAAL